MILLAGEVALPLHRSVVLAFRLVQDDPHPFARGKEGGANVGYSASLSLTGHLHYGADLGNERETKIRGGESVTKLHMG